MKENFGIFIMSILLWFGSFTGMSEIKSIEASDVDARIERVADFIVSSDMDANAEVLAVELSEFNFEEGQEITWKDIQEAKELLMASDPGNPDPAVVNFIQYLIASLTGLLAIFLKRLIHRFWPDFPIESKVKGKV